MKQKTSQKGLSLLEVLLVVGIASVFITGAATIFDDWFKRSVNQKVASEMLELQDAAEQYVKLNHEFILNDDIGAVGDIAEVDIADMIDGGFLSPTYRARNSFGQSLRVFVRNINDNTVGGVAVEVITVSDDLGGDSRMADSRLVDAATSGGPRLGVISNLNLGPNCCDGNIQSLHGQWSLDLGDFVAVYNRNPDINAGGYMAAYGRVTLNDEIDERYLYRVEVEGRDHLNRMMTNMDLNNNDIINAGTVVSDNMEITGNATLNGNETNGFASPYVLSVGNNFTGDSLTITRDGDSKGDLIVQGDDDNSTYDLDISNNFSLPSGTGNVVTTTSTVNVVQNMGSAAFETMNARAGSFNAGTIVSQNTLVNGNAQTSFLQTSAAEVNDLTASNAVTAVTNVSSPVTNFAGNLDNNNNIAVQGNASLNAARGFDNVNIQNINSCGAGCP
jgi:type II secretory pathway pseudopilin PulG